MFQPITIVHLFFLGIFSALGLKGMIRYRGKRVFIRLGVGGRSALQLSYSDFVLLFAALSFMSLDGTSLEFLEWAMWQLKHGPKVASVIALSFYVTALICSLAYTFCGSLVVMAGGISWLFGKARNSPGQ